MKPLLPILLWLWPGLATAQAKEVSSFQKKDTSKTALRQAQGYQPSSAKAPGVNPASAKATAVKPEILSSGFIDIINNGQVNASARSI